ncbi:MAG: amidohydrolase [Chloroflexi bacterium]|nr:amidohydrolase [Chloroflexota bacterium]MBU1749697.1 amidohydrolase [Chloroflexota bacterium]
MTIYDGATIITVDPQRRIIRDGALAVQGNRLAAVGKSAEVRAQFPTARRVDISGKLVFPGLVDTHVHLAQALIRGCADDMDLIPWLTERVWVLQGNYTAVDGRASAALCIAEMLKSGTTTFLEAMLAGRYGLDGIGEVMVQSGIRGIMSKIVMDIAAYADGSNAMYPGMVEERETSMRQALEAYDRWNGAGNGRVQVWFGPRTPGGVSVDLYQEMVREARQRDMGITMHLGEVQADVDFMCREFDTTLVGFCDSVGMLGPKTVLVHTVWLSPPEIARLAETGTSISHNPSSNTKLASGFAPIPEMLDAGVNVTLGCDGGPSNNSYDLIREMKLAAVVHKGRTLDPLVVPAETVLEMATINGARALGLEDEIGSLEVGKKADFVVLDMDRPGLTPSPNPVSTLVYAAMGSDVDTVVIDGQVVVQGSRLLTLDEEAVVAEARQRAAEVYERAGIVITPRWPVF